MLVAYMLRFAVW